jgi:hypothetical protein
MKQTSLTMDYSMVTGFTENMKVITQVNLNGIPYYDMISFERIYKVNYSTVDRCIKKDSSGLIRVNGKKYVNEVILQQTKKGIEYWQSISEKQQVAEGLQIDITNKDLCIEFVFTGITLNTGVQYFDMEQFATRFKIGYSQLYGLVKNLPTNNRYQFCIAIGGRLYVSPHLLIYLKRHLSHLTNLEYAWMCNRYTWDIVGTIRLEQYMTPKACRDLMERLFNRLCNKFLNTPHYLFFVTEQNPGCDGYHSHFVYGNHNHPQWDEVSSVINKVLQPYGGNIQRRSLLEKINQKDYFIEYMVKQIHKMPDGYDWLHKNIF